MPSVGVKIYIGNLPERARPEEIKECFTKFGSVVNMELKGNYGFIEYEERRMCDEAISQLHGSDFQGSQLRVEYAHAERSGGAYKYKEGKSTDTCFKCGQVGHWARECTSNGRGDLSTHRKISSRYDDRRVTDSYVREPYSARDARDKYDRDERPLPPPLDRGYDRPNYDRYAREPELEYRRDYRNTYDRGYDRERDRTYDRAYPERDYERYGRNDNYDRSYYPPPRDGYERDGYDRRPLPPPDVASYPARGRTGSPPPRRASYERGIRPSVNDKSSSKPSIYRDQPISNYRGRSPLPPSSRYPDSLMGAPPSMRPPSPRTNLYRRRSLSPLRGGRASLPYSGRPRSPSPIGRPLPPRRGGGGGGGPRTPTPPPRR